MKNEKVYNKLVRDKIPQIIESNCKNEIAIIRLIENIEYKNELNRKLQEEVQEYLADESLEELADILEVIHGLLFSKNKTFAELEQIRKEKAEKRGGFEKRIFLEKVKSNDEGGIEMGGCRVKEGYVTQTNLSKEEMWATLNNFLNGHVMFTSTYKFAFFMSLLDSLDDYKKGSVIAFNEIFAYFTKLYWDDISNNGLNQIRMTSKYSKSNVENIITEFKQIHQIEANLSFNEIPLNLRNKLIKQVSKDCQHNVIGALFGDTKKALYSFNKKENWIKINDCFYDFLKENKNKLQRLIRVEWDKFLGSIN